MILHRLRVTHWRSLLNPIELGPFDERINVIHAPNGTGKSSLFEALRRALFDGFQVQGKEMDAVRPWGRALAPQVMVEFSEKGTRYQLEKQFLDNPSALLLREESGEFKRIAAGREADALLREILAAPNSPGRGASKPQHWGLQHVLWTPQGQLLALEDLSPDLTGTLRAVLGCEIRGELGGRFEQLLAEEYTKYFTSGGRMRRQSPWSLLKVQHDEQLQKRVERLDRYRLFEEVSRAVEDARQRRSQARREADSIRRASDDARLRLESHRRLNEELQARQSDEAAARSRYEALSQSLEWIGRTRQELQQWELDSQQWTGRLQTLIKEADAAAKGVETAQRERSVARAARDQFKQEEKRVDAARCHAEETAACRQLERRIDLARQIQEELESARKQGLDWLAPDARTVKRVRTLQTLVETTRAALAASQIHLTVEPEQEITATDVLNARSKTIPACEPTTFSGSPEVVLTVEGFGRIRACGPEGEAARHETELGGALREMETLCRPFGTTDAESLQHRLEKARQYEGQVQELERRLKEHLEGGTLEEWIQELGRLTASVSARLETYPDWAKNPPDVEQMQVLFRQERQQKEEAVAEKESEWERARAAAQFAGEQVTAAKAHVSNLAVNQEHAAGRLAKLLEDGMRDEDRARIRQEALMRWEASRVQVERIREQLALLGDDPVQEVARLEKQLQNMEAVAEAARDSENQADGRLKALVQEGAHTQWVVAEEKLAELERAMARESLLMDALQRLQQTVQACRSRMVSTLVGPVAQTATQMFNRVSGPKLGEIHLNEGFLPVGTRPGILDEPVDWGNLSGGEQEQLFLIVRLALARVLAREQRQMVVLDDVLHATDTARLGRVMRLLEEASDSLQIVLLSCQPERYAFLQDVNRMELQPT